MSRLAAFCEKLIEACWLAAIIVAPLFFNIYSSRVFEPDKISLVRTLALVMLAAWLLLRAEIVIERPARRTSTDLRGFRNLEGLRGLALAWSSENPLTLPALFLAAIYVVSTLASVAPASSLLGSYQRLQGLYTTLSYIVIFFLAASTIRSRVQVDRAINVALVVSFPIAFYGIIQHYFLDPLPWAGDTTTRVASNMGNSIFVGAYLIMVVPLALGRLVEHAQKAAQSLKASETLTVSPALVYGGVAGSFVVLAGVWGLSFELGAKKLIDAGFTGTLTPEMLAAAEANFNLGLIVTLVVVLGWWAVGLFMRQRAGTFLLIGVYTLVLAVQVVCLLFTQSRGPLLGLLGGSFTFAVVYALVRGARRAALGAVGAAGIVLLFLVLFNIATESPLAPLRDLPFVGRLGRVFDLSEGTGEVRVLIWEGAVKLILPHAPLWSPTTGNDALNALRPLIGYGPETMYVAYNRFYPPDLAHLESRNATPDRSHNETFDALVTTGGIGWIAENLLFLAILYYGLKWLGFITTARQRNAFIALWFVTGAVVAAVFGFVLGWQFIGVALPAGMILGFFIYLVGFALRERLVRSDLDGTRTLLIVVLLAAIVSHFIEIHFGIAIVSTRTYFWFLAALLVALGVPHLVELHPAPESDGPTPPSGGLAAVNPAPSAAPPRRKRRRAARQPQPPARARTSPAENANLPVISTAPLIAFGFAAGLVLATMGFDYVNSNNLAASASQAPSALDIVATSLLYKQTTAGLGASPAMLWLFLGTLCLMLAIGVAEWGRGAVLRLGEWAFAVGLVATLALAIFAIFLFYHLVMLSTTGPGFLDALLAAIGIYVLFIIITAGAVAVTLLFDQRTPPALVARPSNWIIGPGLALLAALLIYSTNVSIVQADVIYKQAAAVASGDTLPTSITLFERALAMQPQQDYYLLFLGRAYLEQAKVTTDPAAREKLLTSADQVLLRAQQINPLNTDHTANLARLLQAWATLDTDPAAARTHYQQALDYFQQAIRLSPDTVHLYDQMAQAQLDFADFLAAQHDTAGSDQARRAAQAQIAQSLALDSTFCLTYATRARAQTDWSAAAQDALKALQEAPACGDTFQQDGVALATQMLATAGDQAASAGAGAQYASLLEGAAHTQPSVQLYTALANYYSKAGQVDNALRATDAALALIPASDQTTRQKYEDFRTNLSSLQGALKAVAASPNDPAAHRQLAQAWLARGQTDLALPEYRKVLALAPADYDAARHITLLLVQSDQLPEATQALTRTLPLAPASDQAFWSKLGAILSLAQQGDSQTASTDLQDLLKTVDPKDTLASNALNALLASLKPAG